MNKQEILALSEIDVPGISRAIVEQLTPIEIVLSESLLTPGLQTFIKIHSAANMVPVKNYDEFKGKTVKLKIVRKILSKFGFLDTMLVDQTIYRMEERHLFDPNIEELIIRACDPSLLEDAESLVSKSWKCTTPSAVTSEVLQSCAGVTGVNLDVQSCNPARDYIAENIHPFQVVAQQANVALDGSDPSFLHYMTFGGGNPTAGGIHHFRSLKNLTAASPGNRKFTYSEVPDVYSNPHNIMRHSFPCDFDLLSDILNGINAQGHDISSAAIYNPLNSTFSLFGSQITGCGLGRGNYDNAMTNSGSESLQNACPDYSFLYAQKRQARMSLLEQDKIALRLTIPWNPELHAGSVIYADFPNTLDKTLHNYGTGTYLVSAMSHNIRRGGMAVTNLDCVSTTTGHGEV